MKNYFVALRKNFAALWLSYGKYIFLALGALFAILANCLTHYPIIVYVLAFIFSLTIFSWMGGSNPNSASEHIIVDFGWSIWLYAVLISSCQLIAFSSPVYQCCFGFILGIFLCSLVYVFIPMLTYWLELGIPEARLNSVALPLIIGLILSVILSIQENEAVLDAEFSQAQFIPVSGWTKEIYHGNTVYLIDCPKGTVAVSPSEYPEVRKISPKSEIKFVTGNSPSGGAYGALRFEIRNQ